MFKRFIFLFFFLVAAFVSKAQNTFAYTDVSLHFRNAVELYEKKNYAAAREEFQVYLDKEALPDNKDQYNRVSAHYYVAVCALLLNYPEAELLADRFVVNYAEYPQAGQLFKQLGLYYFDNEDFNKAATYLEKVGSRHLTEEESLEVRLKLGISYYNLQNYDKALQIFTSIKQYSNNKYGEIASYYSGHLNFRKENLDEAINDFKRIENSKQYKNEAPGIIAQILYKQGKYDEVLKYALPLLNSKDNKTGIKLEDLALLTAEVYFSKSDFQNATTYYGQYINFKSQPVTPAVRYRYGYSLYKTNNFNAAITNLKTVASSKDEIGQYAAYFLGITYLKNDAPNLALAAFDQAGKATFNPQVQEDSEFNRAKVLVDLKRNGEAIKDLKEFLAKYANSKYEDEANELLSEAYLGSNDYASAIKYIESLPRKTPKINASYQRLTFNQGVIYFNGENFTDAIKFFDKSLTITADAELKAQTLYWKAEAFSATKNFAGAIPIYKSINTNLEGEPYSKLNYALGYAQFNTKDYAGALSSFKNYTNATKGNADKATYDDALARMADCFFVNKNFEEADKIYDQVLVNSKSDKDYILFQKALSLEFQNKDAEAKVAYDKVATQYPNSRFADDALFKIAALEFNSGNYQLAIRQFNKLILEKQQSPLMPQALLKRAVAYTNLQNLEGAAADYRTIIDKYCDTKSAESAILGIQDLLNDLNRSDEYAAILQAFKKCNPGNQSLESIEYESVKSIYFNQNYEKAIQGFLTYMQSYPTSNNVSEAKYFIGDSYARINDKQNALRFLYMVIAEKKSTYFAKALSKTADLELSSQNYQKAIQNFKLLSQNATDKKELVKAWSGLAESFYQTSKFDSSLVYTREIINAGSVNLGAQNKALLLQGKIYEAKGDYIKATEEYNKCIKTVKDDIGAEAKYLVCNLQFKQKKYEECKKECLDFSTAFPDSDLWRGRAFLVYADACLATNDKLQAKATLESLIENSDDKTTIEAAKAKLKNL